VRSRADRRQARHSHRATITATAAVKLLDHFAEKGIEVIALTLATPEAESFMKLKKRRAALRKRTGEDLPLVQELLFQSGKAAHFTRLAWGLNHLVVTPEAE